MLTIDDLTAEAPDLFRFAASISYNRDDVPDLVQDTLLRALERADQYRADGELGAWLRKILLNLAIDRGRRSARELVVDEVEADWRQDEYTVDPALVAEQADTREELLDGLARLPFIYRTAVMLHDAEEWTVAAIAELEEISIPAAKQRLRRGRMMLVSALAGGAVRRRALKGVPMRCWDARQHVSEYLNGTLDRALAVGVEAHLERCPTCPPLYAALVGVRERMGALRDPDDVIPPDLVEAIRDQVSSGAA